MYTSFSALAIQIPPSSIKQIGSKTHQVSTKVSKKRLINVSETLKKKKTA